MSEVTFKISNQEQIRSTLNKSAELIRKALKGGDVILTLGREKRTVSQNALLWPLLTDISKQVEWFNQTHSPEAWKDIITGSWSKCEFVPNIEGNGLVAVGLSTSKLSKRDFSALIEYIFAFGADKGVEWREKSKQVIDENREAA